MRPITVLAMAAVLVVAWFAGYLASPSPASMAPTASYAGVGQYVFTVATEPATEAPANSTSQQRTETEYVTQILTTEITGAAAITTICTTPSFVSTTSTITVTSTNSTQSASTKIVTRYVTTSEFSQTITSWECVDSTVTQVFTYVTTTT
jgi:hypothetical protein